ncbi:MAG: hypothetical protein ACK55Z_10240 [bacterium]
MRAYTYRGITVGPGSQRHTAKAARLRIFAQPNVQTRKQRRSDVLLSADSSKRS